MNSQNQKPKNCSCCEFWQDDPIWGYRVCTVGAIAGSPKEVPKECPIFCSEQDVGYIKGVYVITNRKLYKLVALYKYSFNNMVDANFINKKKIDKQIISYTISQISEISTSDGMEIKSYFCIGDFGTTHIEYIIKHKYLTLLSAIKEIEENRI